MCRLRRGLLGSYCCIMAVRWCTRGAVLPLIMPWCSDPVAVAHAALRCPALPLCTLCWVCWGCCCWLQVRAEHRAEHDMFRAVLLGHSKPGGGAAAGGGGGSNTSQNRPFAAAAGSAGAGSSQPRLFMQQKHA